MMGHRSPRTPGALGLTIALLVGGAAAAGAGPDPHAADQKLRVLRADPLHRQADEAAAVRAAAVAGFNVLALPGEQDLAAVRRRADLAAAQGIACLQWMRGARRAHEEDDVRFVGPDGLVSQLHTPNADVFWEWTNMLVTSYARISAEQPALIGVLLDFSGEDGPCFDTLSYDRAILEAFAAARGLDMAAPDPARPRAWLEERGIHDAFEAFQVERWRRRCRALRRAADEYNPRFQFCLTPTSTKFVLEAACREWATERAPLLLAATATDELYDQHESFENALRSRRARLEEQAAWARDLGIPCRLLGAVDPLDQRADPEHCGRSAAMIAQVADGYWVAMAGPPDEAVRREGLLWLARANQAISDGCLDFWRQVRQTPIDYARRPAHPDLWQLGASGLPRHAHELLRDHADFETAELGAAHQLEARYLAHFGVVCLSDFRGGSNDPRRIADALRTYVHSGGGLLLVHDAGWFRQSPFPEIARVPEAAEDRRTMAEHAGPLTVAMAHDGLGPVQAGTTFEPLHATHAAWEPGPAGHVLIRDGAGRAVLVAGSLGSGRVAFAGLAWGWRLPTATAANTTMSGEPGPAADQDHRDGGFPEGPEREILLGVVRWLAGVDARWWDFEYDGSVDPTLATPTWTRTGESASGTADGGVWRQRPDDRWAGFKLCQDGGTWQMPATTTVEVRFRFEEREQPGLLYLNGPQQWQAMLQGGGDTADVLHLAGGGGGEFQLDEQWNVLRLLIDGGTIHVYLRPGGAPWRGGARAAGVERPIAAAWTGYGADGDELFQFGGNLDIDYVRWTHRALVPPPAVDGQPAGQ